MPPTNNNNALNLDWSQDFETLLAQIRMNGDTRINAAIQRIKEFCPTLVAYGIDTLRAEYDGEGDSGNMDVYVVNPKAPPVGNTVITNNLRSFSQETEHKMLMQYMQKMEQLPDKPFTQQQISDLEDALYELLPGGWEINDGSFGEVVVKPSENSVYMQHNERYSEVNTTERTW